MKLAGRNFPTKIAIFLESLQLLPSRGYKIKIIYLAQKSENFIWLDKLIQVNPFGIKDRHLCESIGKHSYSFIFQCCLADTTLDYCFHLKIFTMREICADLEI